ncbi:MAG: MFS transporter [Candidatus Hodarchaeota archaeon]
MEKTTGKLSRRNLWGYAIGAIPGGLYTIIFNLKYIEFFYDQLKLLPIYFIIGQIIYMTVNALNDPILGNVSDRTDYKRWGSRRIVYIKWGALIFAFCFLLVWFPWSLTNQLIIFLHYVISICLFDTMFTLIVMVWMALLPEMTSDLDERNKANFLTGLLGLVVVLPFLIIVGEMNPNSDSFRIICIFVALISTICLGLVAYLCKERPELQTEENFPLLKSVKEVLKSRSFLIYTGYNFMGAINGSIGLSYLFVYLLILGDGGFLVYLVFGIILGYVSNIICIRLHEKGGWDMRKIILRFGTIRIIGTFIMLPFILFTDNLLMIYILLIFGTLFSGYGLFNTPLLYLSMDEDEIKNKVRREAMFLGMQALFTKPAQSIGPIIATTILTFFLYEQGADIQLPSAIFGIKILFFLIPAVSTLTSLVFMYIYPLHGDELGRMRTRLQEIHEEKISKSDISNVTI